MPSSTEPKEISVRELRVLMESPHPPALVDVREGHELRNGGWISGMKHVPMNEVPNRLGELNSQEPIVVYCQHGMRSYDVACYLMEQGFGSVSSLDGGFACWNGRVETES